MLSCFDLTGKVAIVTGASKGLGLSFATGLAKSGCNLFLIARSEELLKKNVEMLKGFGIKCDYYVADITNEEQIQAAVDKCVEEFGKIDVLFNNAGAERYPVEPEDAPIEMFEKVMKVNSTGCLIVAKAVGKVMIKQGYGKIINLGSLCADKMINSVALGGYDISKSAVHGITKVLAISWAKYGVTTNAIAPGFFMTEPNVPYFVPGSTFIEECPMKRVGQPEELEGVAVFMASSATDFMNGAIVKIDGGISLK